MLLANYASDSGSDSESESSNPGPSRPIAPPAKLTTASIPPAHMACTAGTSSASGAGVKGKKRGGPVRITLDLPKVSGDEEGEKDENQDGNEEEREVKKPKLGGVKGGKGSSSLLGMLPPPKRKLPTPDSKSALAVNKSMAAKPVSQSSIPVPSGLSAAHEEDEDELTQASGSGLLLPASVARGKAKAEKKDEALDLFGLGSAPSASTASAATASSLPKPATITSAPTVSDFIPPPPSASDPYPGYYQLPSGTWAAYDPDYYHSFFSSTPSLQPAEEEMRKGSDGRVGHHWDELVGREGEVVDFDPTAGIAEARREEERKSNMVKVRTLGDDYEYKAIGQIKGLASERHQLTSLLNTAYTQREALEERLQANKKSMREARTKYGF